MSKPIHDDMKLALPFTLPLVHFANGSIITIGFRLGYMDARDEAFWINRSRNRYVGAIGQQWHVLAVERYRHKNRSAS